MPLDLRTILVLGGLALSPRLQAIPANISLSALLSTDGRSLEFYIENDNNFAVICPLLSARAKYKSAAGVELGSIDFRYGNSHMMPLESSFFAPEPPLAAQQLLAANPSARISTIDTPLQNCEVWDHINILQPLSMATSTFNVLQNYTSHQKIINNVYGPKAFVCGRRPLTAKECSTQRTKAVAIACITNEYSEFLRTVPIGFNFGVAPLCGVEFDANGTAYPFVDVFCACES